MQSLDKICQLTCIAAKTTGAYIRNESIRFNLTKVEYKSEHDLVSYVDKTAEQQLVDALTPLIPGCGFITEEDHTREMSKEYNWIIDPLDGTTNFVHGLRPFCVSIALMHKNKIVLGVVYEIGSDEMFYAWKNSKAYLNGEEISCSKTTELSKSLLATGFPVHDYNRLDAFMEVLIHCMKHTRGLRRLGSAAADLVYVACGRLDGFFEYSLNAWDVAAGAFIVQQAGGNVSDFKGQDNFLFGKEIIANNAGTFDEFLLVLQQYFNKK